MDTKATSVYQPRTAITRGRCLVQLDLTRKCFWSHQHGIEKKQAQVPKEGTISKYTSTGCGIITHISGFKLATSMHALSLFDDFQFDKTHSHKHYNFYAFTITYVHLLMPMKCKICIYSNLLII